MKTLNKNYAAIILAGGHSSRMNYPKPWLKKGESTFLGKIIAVFKQFGIHEIIVVINEKFTSKEWKNELFDIVQNCKIIKNPHPERGRLYSLQLGLKVTTTDNLFIHNVDNPFIEERVLKLLQDHHAKTGVSIPSFKGKGGHPVIITQAINEELKNNYQNYKTLKEVFSNFPEKYIEVNTNSILKNINTPQELEEMDYELA